MAPPSRVFQMFGALLLLAASLSAQNTSRPQESPFLLARSQGDQEGGWEAKVNPKPDPGPQ